MHDSPQLPLVRGDIVIHEQSLCAFQPPVPDVVMAASPPCQSKHWLSGKIAIDARTTLGSATVPINIAKAFPISSTSLPPLGPLVHGRKRRGRDFHPRFGRGPGKAYGTRERKCAQSRRIPCIADFHVELSRFRPSPSIAQNAKDSKLSTAYYTLLPRPCKGGRNQVDTRDNSIP